MYKFLKKYVTAMNENLIYTNVIFEMIDLILIIFEASFPLSFIIVMT